MAEVLELSEDVRNLCKWLADKDSAPISALPKALQAPGTLARAVAKGLAEVGRLNYSEVITGIKPRKTSKGEHVFDENFRQVVDKETKIVHDADWCWTNLRGRQYKPMGELLAEDAKLPKELHLHIRLTTDGLAAS